MAGDACSFPLEEDLARDRIAALHRRLSLTGEHHRRQAERLNELASSTSDPETAELMRRLAAEYMDEAALAADRARLPAANAA